MKLLQPSRIIPEGKRLDRTLIFAGSLVLLDLLAVVFSGKWSLTGSEVSHWGVAVRLLALAAIGLGLYRLRGWKDGYRLTLALLLLLSIYQFHVTSKRMVADGFYYYAYVQSFWKDFDVHFENEYRQYDILERPSIETPTKTGYRRNIFSAGPAVLWSPFFGVGELYGRLAAWRGHDVNLGGYGLFHWNAVSFGTLCYGFVGVLLIQSLLRRYFSHPVAFAGAVITWWGTNFYWYMVYQPLMSHALATFMVALFIWYWDRSRLQRGWRDALVLGLIGGLTVCVRWQNGLIWFLPFLDWLWGLRQRSRPVIAAGPVFLAGILIGLLPQMLAWNSIYDQFFFLQPPHGTGFVRFERPFFWETLFSSRHGLLSWTPVLWLGFLGLVPLLFRRKPPVWMMVIPLVLMTYTNMSVIEWWSANSFSNRRFDGALPILAFGIAYCAERFWRFTSRRPALVAGGLLALFPLWNLLFMEQYHRHNIPIDDTVSFTQVASNAAEIAFDKVGYPFAWPLNWWFAWTYDTSPSKYDMVYGRYLFYLHRLPEETMEIGEDDGGLVGEGWYAPELREGRWVRATRRQKTRLFVHLERDENLRMTFNSSARPQPVEVIVEVNGNEVGRFQPGPGFTDYRLAAPTRFEKGINTLDLRPQFAEPGHFLLLDRVVFQRLADQ